MWLESASATCEEDDAKNENHADKCEHIGAWRSGNAKLGSAIPDNASTECASSGEGDHPDENPMEERRGTLPVHLRNAARSNIRRLVHATGEMVGEVFEDDIEFAFELSLSDHRDEEGGEAIRVAAECGGEPVSVLDICSQLVNNLAEEWVIGLFFESVEDVENVDLRLHQT